jgi:hypothetical protein
MVRKAKPSKRTYRRVPGMAWLMSSVSHVALMLPLPASAFPRRRQEVILPDGTPQLVPVEPLPENWRLRRR